ncbi:hypothetical protein B0H19DRAFT_1059719 [Mycena capillaripes]|nr:hypothetical protein B0H19DRAFT_1059719 [Mycena capillaripes]
MDPWIQRMVQKIEGGSENPGSRFQESVDAGMGAARDEKEEGNIPSQGTGLRIGQSRTRAVILPFSNAYPSRPSPPSRIRRLTWRQRAQGYSAASRLNGRQASLQPQKESYRMQQTLTAAEQKLTAVADAGIVPSKICDEPKQTPSTRSPRGIYNRNTPSPNSAKALEDRRGAHLPRPKESRRTSIVASATRLGPAISVALRSMWTERVRKEITATRLEKHTGQ